VNAKIGIVPAIALIAAFSGCAGPESRVNKTSGAIIGMNTPVDYNPAKMADLASRYKSADFTADRLQTYSDRTLTILFEALNDGAFHLRDNAALVKMQECVLAEKIRRGKFLDHDIRDMIVGYVRQRSFDKAAALKNRFPEFKLPCVPEIIPSTAPAAGLWRVYDVSDGGKKVQIKTLPLENGPIIVMAMLTGCSVGEKAMSELLADPELGPAFRKYGIIITDKFDSVGVAMWRDYFKFPEVYLTAGKKYFPGFTLDSSPYFHFIRDGKIVTRMDGWGNDGKEDFRKNLHAFLPPEAEAK